MKLYKHSSLKTIKENHAIMPRVLPTWGVVLSSMQTDWESGHHGQHSYERWEVKLRQHGIRSERILGISTHSSSHRRAVRSCTKREPHRICENCRFINNLKISWRSSIVGIKKNMSCTFSASYPMLLCCNITDASIVAALLQGMNCEHDDQDAHHVYQNSINLRNNPCNSASVNFVRTRKTQRP